MNQDALTLYSYWRSSAAYRVRIGLELKHLSYELRAVNLVREGGEQHRPEYRALNPQQLVPTLLHGRRVMTQSLAILEYLEETFPEPAIMPATARERARVRALALAIACDIHPLNNLRVLQYLEREWNVPQAEREAWVRRWIETGFEALEVMLADNPSTGDFCEGELPSIADCCLVPQVYNARRFGVDMGRFPTIERIERNCLALPEFQAARPESQPDAPLAVTG